MAPSLNIQRRTSSGGKDFGAGTKPGPDFNNAGFLALFALIGAGMVIASIYFFFVAKNGGFYWKKGDWDDYKSTVLRRKGPDGKTLSNATKSTKLGGGSVVPKWAKSEYTNGTESTYDPKDERDVEAGRGRYGRRDRREASKHDPELAAYKHEKAAKVGGINTSLRGSEWDYTNTDRSEVTVAESRTDKHAASKADKERKRREKAEQKQQARDAAQRAKEEKKARKGKRSTYDDDRSTTVSTAIEEPSRPEPSRPEPSRSEPSRPDRTAHRSYPSNAYSFHQGDDGDASVYTATNTVTTDNRTQPSIRQVSYYEAYRPSSNLAPVSERPTPASSHVSSHHSEARRSHRSSRESINHGQTQRSTPSHSRQGSPRKQHRSGRPSSDYTTTTDTGTKVYTHHIPGLSKGEVGVEDSVSQVGSRPRNSGVVQQSAPSSSGYRRGGRGRRDSLSESEM